MNVLRLLLKILLATLFFLLLLELSYRAAEHIMVKLNTKDSQNSQYPICMIGGSTSVGEPFQDKISIPKLVSYALNGKIKEREISIHNLASQ